MSKPRFPQSVYGTGEEPDPRFSLANERTFLAWIRTGLALLAGAVALQALPNPMPGVLRLITALVLVLTALIVVLQAWIGWVRTERAMREDRPLPGPLATTPVTVSLIAVIALVAFGLVWGNQ
ncbi:MAG TPA: DUF202 domain-containing protein [Beutenbergiaceae bacterium]|nr:DUF202 domain-containing protein [Beutenbergiaceae bacterium]